MYLFYKDVNGWFLTESVVETFSELLCVSNHYVPVPWGYSGPHFLIPIACRTCPTGVKTFYLSTPIETPYHTNVHKKFTNKEN